MASRKWPYFGVSEGISDFDESLTVQSELESTKINTILKKFQVTGVLPNVGRASLPADVYFGGEDFQDLQQKLLEARNSGLTEEKLLEMLRGESHDEGEDVDEGSGEGSGEGAGSGSGEEAEQKK